MSAISEYLKRIEHDIEKSISTEHTYRAALEGVIESIAEGVDATNEPKRVACGAPDFIVTRGQTPLGYVEAKDVGKSLDAIEADARRKEPKTHDGEQLQRFLESLGNLILTDYLEFRWYVGGEHRLTARLAQLDAKGKLRKTADGAEQLTELLTCFLSAEIPTVTSAKELAARMARLGQLIRDTIRRAFEHEDKGGSLHEQMEGFRKVLIHDLTEDQFADMYAQTICYGLFAARYAGGTAVPAVEHDRETSPAKCFTRQRAPYDLPKTNPFLRKMFGYIAGPELDQRITWAVDDLAELLNRADMEAILRDFGRRTRREDPVVHFYETFLAAYDPKMREVRGVYYTPEPVVSYIVRSIDHILKKDFRLDDGLADTRKLPMYDTVKNKKKESRRVKKGECHKVLVLDPAVGTGSFLYAVIAQIHEHIVAKGQGGAWSGYVSDHLLPRVFGFELLMAPYAVAHMKLALELGNSGYDFKSGERLRVYLTNTLEEALEIVGLPLFAEWLAEEANAAGMVKQEAPVMVVLGNPPYSGQSANIGHWIVDLLHGHDSQTAMATGNYFEVDGKPLGEKNPKWLNDDYVKFIRFAQWRIERTGYGILAFITNHSYLDNPTFRGMRQSLMESFDEIYVLDLHGNAKKKERCPDGSKDENVFDIQQGVAISIFVKRNVTPPSRRQAGEHLVEDSPWRAPQKVRAGRPQDCRQDAGGTTGGRTGGTIRHADLWGMREVYEKDRDRKEALSGGKYHWLWHNDVASTEWTTLEPRSPFYLFVPQNVELLGEYQRGWKVTHIFPVNSVGIVTARDKLTIHWTAEEAWKTVTDFCSLPPEEARAKYSLGNDARDWKVAFAQEELKVSGPTRDNVTPILYRPFDLRYTYYTGKSRGFHCMPRGEVMRHMLAGPNMGFVTCRQVVAGSWQHLLATKRITDDCYVSNQTRERGYLLPLYVYAETREHPLTDAASRRPNLAPAFVEEFARRLGLKFEPERSAAVSAAVPGASRSRRNEGGTPSSLPAGCQRYEVARPSFRDVTIRHRGHLPHWETEGGIYFVTFRLADALPRSVLESYRSERQHILDTAGQQHREISASEKKRLDELFSERIESYLDSGSGECHLTRAEVARVVADALRHFDGERYRLLAWCIMPNHVHVVVKALPGHDLADIVHSWKSFTAKEANKILGRTGEFWQTEYYDRLVRDEEELWRIVEYVQGNPEKANLTGWKWVWADELCRQDADTTAGQRPALQQTDRPDSTADEMRRQDADTTAGETPAVRPEDVLHYMYAVFHSPTYRSRYAEFLKIDFPRVPLTSNVELFRELCALGEELVGLHLMEKYGPDMATYLVAGDNKVEKVRYTAPAREPSPQPSPSGRGSAGEGGRVWINKTQYFDGVPPEVWEFHIGGYQVCEKWLKDRKGRQLSFDDVKHYQHIVSALAETIHIMAAIDRTIDTHGGWPIQ